MAIYMQIDGIQGEVTESKHDKWIQLDSLAWGVARSVDTEPGKVANRGNSKPSFSDVSVTKRYDASSPKIFTWSTAGAGKKVVVHFAKEDGSNYIEITLESVIPTSYQLSSGGEDPTESLSLNFTKVEVKRIPYDKDNKAGTPVAVQYDLVTMTGK